MRARYMVLRSIGHDVWFLITWVKFFNIILLIIIILLLLIILLLIIILGQPEGALNQSLPYKKVKPRRIQKH